MSSQALIDSLERLKSERKAGKLTTTEFYRSLLKLTKELLDRLCEESIDENEARKQIPLILAFLEEQIRKYAQRGN
ncbi:MAG: hypothetical protein GXO04_04895 [Aquificae bacterium]|nr:hypothetical protein [Aquificota bacterium]